MEIARPLMNGEFAFFTIPWPNDWFDPARRLLRFPYVGSFESQFSRLWFACDGKDVAPFEAWAASLTEMKSSPSKTARGEIGSERLASLDRYLETRARAEAMMRNSSQASKAVPSLETTRSTLDPSTAPIQSIPLGAFVNYLAYSETSLEHVFKKLFCNTRSGRLST